MANYVAHYRKKLQSLARKKLPRDRQIAVYCQVGQRGYLATRILLQSGFKAVNIGGGYKTYKLYF